MSDYQTKDGFGNIFPNKRKQKDTHPDYTGECRYKGELIEIAGWKKQGNAGPYLSLKVQAPRAKQDKPSGGGARGPAPKDELDDGSDIPFITNGGDY